VGCLYREDRLVTTAGVAFDGTRYFLARRQAGGAQSRRWEFPGGKCDADDADERSCLAREYHEEFGITIDVGDEIGSVPFEHKSIRYILVAYRVTFHTVPTELSVHSETGWFLPDELPDLDLADSDRIFIEQFLSIA
jgi:8-oxo-dGTP diphosphatase